VLEQQLVDIKELMRVAVSQAELQLVAATQAVHLKQSEIDKASSKASSENVASAPLVWNKGTSCAAHALQREHRWVKEKQRDVVCFFCDTYAFCEPVFRECWTATKTTGHLPKSNSTNATHPYYGLVSLNHRLLEAARKPGPFQCFGKDKLVKKEYLLKLPSVTEKRDVPVRAAVPVGSYKESPEADPAWVLTTADPNVVKSEKLLGDFNKLFTPKFLGRHVRATLLKVSDMESPRTMSQVRG
jgi:hypothetical protein